MVAQVDRSAQGALLSIPNTRVASLLPTRRVVLSGLLVLALVIGTTLMASGFFSPTSAVATSAPSVGHFQVFASTSSGNSTTDTGLDNAILALAAAVCMAGGFIGTGMAQSGIGASGMGIIAEKREKFGTVLVFFVIPETLWILGFVFGILLLKQTL